ncbi:MAG: hypothetical protein J2P30_17060 [Actinobacteria bacterium]|nr:hypothetical protein [Actinomycetota bacterium]
MAGRPPARRPVRGSGEAGYPAAPYRSGWCRDGAGDGRDRGDGYWRHAAEDHRDGADGGYRGTRHRRDATGGAAGNERLTGLTGMVLLVLLAAEGVTILSVRRLLTLHFFLGMLLIGPVVLKACSTLYRFVRYYAGAAAYWRKGPPAPLLRLLGPVVLVTSVAVLGSGVMLALTGPGGGAWLLLHKASFVLWFGAMTVHVLAYIWRLPRLARGDLAGRAGRRAGEVLAGRGARWLLVIASVLAGLLLAVLTVHRAGRLDGVARPGGLMPDTSHAPAGPAVPEPGTPPAGPRPGGCVPSRLAEKVPTIGKSHSHEGHTEARRHHP